MQIRDKWLSLFFLICLEKKGIGCKKKKGIPSGFGKRNKRTSTEQQHIVIHIARFVFLPFYIYMEEVL